MNVITAIGGDAPTNGAAVIIDASRPYVARVTVRGVADFLFHRYQADSVEAKGKAAKGSAAKKSDDVDSYVYRTEDGELAIPGEYLRQSIVGAARYRQDPRSPRKSAMDLFKAAVVPLTVLAPLGKHQWDYEDRRRVVVQRNAVTRVRPAMRTGWQAEFELLVNTPEYLGPEMLLEVLGTAGRLIGLGDFRPTYGRYGVVSFAIGAATSE